MKLYIENYDVKNILKVLKKTSTIRKKLHCSERITETIYSKQGIYQITNNDIFKLNVNNESSQRIPCDKTISCDKNNNEHWILDKTCFLREKVFQIPVEHVKITLIQYIFSQSPESKVRFIVEMNFKDEREMNLREEKEKNIVDFYFDIYDNNDIPWQEINEFLLMWK